MEGRRRECIEYVFGLRRNLVVMSDKILVVVVVVVVVVVKSA